MGLDSLIENDEEYTRSINYILIKNGVCKSMKEINYTLNKNIDYCKRTGTDLFADFKKKNPNHLKAVENKRKEEEEERKKPKSKFSNNDY
jgi:hypothetical protein